MTTSGELLANRLQRGPLPREQAIDIGRQLATALAAAHAAHMIHRALEPSNILLADDGVKLVDFDVAMARRPLLVGTSRYGAPECKWSTDADRRSDVYTLGCILFEMIYGHVPTAESRATSGDGLAATIDAMLAKDPDARPTMAAVAEQLGAPRSVGATLGDLDEAYERYESTLDAYFANEVAESQLDEGMRSFQAIDNLLTAQRDWKRLERSHRKMIRRLAGSSSPAIQLLQATLFDKLGEIYFSRLSIPDSARVAFETAQQMDPDNRARTEGVDRAARLAELQRT